MAEYIDLDNIEVDELTIGDLPPPASPTRRPMELRWDAPRHIEGSPEWIRDIVEQKDRVLDLSKAIHVPIRFGDYPPTEKAKLHYVSLHHLSSSSSTMEELIKSNSGHLADWEEMTWDHPLPGSHYFVL